MQAFWQVNRIFTLNATQPIETTSYNPSVDQSKYETGIGLRDIGVISGEDLTTEAAITKLMFLMYRFKNVEVKKQLKKSLRGEMN